jgi:hypothetical protein
MSFAMDREEETQDDPRVAERATLTAEEREAGTADAQKQAAAILADADERSATTRDTPGVERRSSEDTVPPDVDDPT